jgi:hypothetical protein
MTLDHSTASILQICLSYASQAEKIELLGHVSVGKWREVLRLAKAHSVEPLLYPILNPLEINLPDDVAVQLKQKHRINAMRNLSLYQELHRLLEPLQKEGITVIVLKGAYLAEAVYDDIGLRSMVDVDLLVKESDLLKVEQKLLELGFVPEDYNRVFTQDNFHFAYKSPRRDLAVEIHWTILPITYPFHIEVDGLWKRAQNVNLMQTSVLALSSEDLLLHLCLHTAEHVHTMHFRMLYDIGEVIRCFGTKLNWQEIGERAKQWDICRPVYIILRLAKELLRVPIPADLLLFLQPADFDEHYFEVAEHRIVVECGSLEIIPLKSIYLAQFWESKKLRRKLDLIYKRLLPSRETLSLWYPAPANSWRIYLYYPIRVKDVLVRHGAALWRLIRGDSKTQTTAEHSNRVSNLHDWMMLG